MLSNKLTDNPSNKTKDAVWSSPVPLFHHVSNSFCSPLSLAVSCHCYLCAIQNLGPVNLPVLCQHINNIISLTSEAAINVSVKSSR